MLEVDFSVPMSTSMSITLPYPTSETTNGPTTPPVMDSPSQSPSEEPTVSFEPSESLEPTTPVATERFVAGPCDGDPTRTTTVTMEVELALNKPVDEYTTDLDAALTKALGSSYPLCESIVRRRNRQRTLEGDDDLNTMHLGEINVRDMGTDCEPLAETATACRNIQVDVEEYGGTGQEDIAALIRFIIAENEDFDNEMMQNDILAIRVIDESTDNGINESNSSTSRSSASGNNGEMLTAGTTAVVVVASLAAVSLIGAALLRRGSQSRRNGTAYMEAFDEYECKRDRKSVV